MVVDFLDTIKLQNRMGQFPSDPFLLLGNNHLKEYLIIDKINV